MVRDGTPGSGFELEGDGRSRGWPGPFATVTTRADAYASGGTRRSRLPAPDDTGGSQPGHAQNPPGTVL
jgi:hypothetical protein